ncbi:MAG TPA: SDR family NAD(P)-dependent oxidoreductase [Candidatus Saccharimonadales bacterium]|jgi:NAD(P)-dependent dehydrogenase (short-subunit alcohol dehydrogenase family)|nr:SDR family NAD(P)-dependent oxidoreductase [Candidatus Saccharimonadales bacterium]
MPDFERRSVVVTGATGNLGHAVVRAYLEAGAHVAIPARDTVKANALRDELGALAGSDGDPKVLIADAELADRGSMDAFVERVLRAWGRLDVLASLAGGFGTGSADDIPKIESLWQQNVATVIVPGAACLVPMRARGYGRIVSVAAGSALKAGRNTAGYAMAKGAVVRWTEALAAETKDQGITANAILPATIDHPVNRAKMPKADPKTWVQPEEAAALILFLTSTEASGITGAAIPITGRV